MTAQVFCATVGHDTSRHLAWRDKLVADANVRGEADKVLCKSLKRP